MSEHAAISPWHTRLSPCSPLFLIFFIALFYVGPAPVSMASALSDREEDGLIGVVQSVETRESLLVQIDRYDRLGRLTERVQSSKETSQGLWRMRFFYTYDQAGRRVAETVRDAQGQLVKETRSAYDDRGNRSAEVAVWGDGTFENASLYEYDEVYRRKQALHYNAVQVINRNRYAYDGAGRVLRERFERNYQYDASGNQVIISSRFDMGYEVAISYDDRGHVSEKVVSDLKGRRQGRSEFRYDEHGNQIEERIYNADGRLTDRKTYRYEYDARGNWIIEALQWWDVANGRERLKQSHVRERSITYY